MIASFLYTEKTKNKGWGVFTSKRIKKGTTIEVSPVIVMNKQDFDLLNKTKLHDYIFHWQGNTCCMALGLISVYNHHAPSNCEYFQYFEEGTIEIRTVRDIKKNEELTINYQGEAGSTTPVWFEVKD